MIKYEDIEKANATIKTTPIKNKNYATVDQRIKAFRMVYPTGTIETEMLANDNGVCIFKASIYANITRTTETELVDERVLLGTGTAYEKEASTFINKTSYIENCETSAVGRALAMVGFGIDTGVASAEEVENAINNQNAMYEKIGEQRLEDILTYINDGLLDLKGILDYYNVNKLEDLTVEQGKAVCEQAQKKKHN